MKKTFKLEDLDCANCAAKLENALNKIEGITSAAVNFMGQKMVLEAPDDRFEEVFARAKKTIKKIDPDLTVKA